jgi:phage-related protein
MHEDDEPPTASPSSSHVNEENFQLVFELLDSLASSMGNLTTSMKNLGTLATNMDNFSTMVTQRLSTYDENFARLAQIMEDINERLKQDGIWLLVSHLCFDDAKGEKDMLFFVILYLDVI